MNDAEDKTEEVSTPPHQEESAESEEGTIGVDRPSVIAHFEPGPIGTGLDGSTPFEAGIQGRATVAGGLTESERRALDWEPYVEVDQPVQGEER
jgi:hypothetical protein